MNWQQRIRVSGKPDAEKRAVPAFFVAKPEIAAIGRQWRGGRLLDLSLRAICC
jgi:hypothetical protein